MTSTTPAHRPQTKRRAPADGPRKSIRGARAGLVGAAPETPTDVAEQPRLSAPTVYDPVVDRATTLTHYRMHLETVPNRRGLPYSKETIGAYVDAVKSLNVYLTEQNFAQGFEAVDVSHLNGYLVWYRSRNDQGGTVTKQGNLRPFFAWVADSFDIPNVYLDKRRNVYKRTAGAPPTLPQECIEDLLRVTSGRTFMDLRDNLIIRLLCVGPRRCEMAALQYEHLDMANKVVWFPPFKGATDLRPVPIPPSALQVAAKYLRARANLPSRPGTEGALLLSAKGGAPLTRSGIAQMVKRRADEAGWDPNEIHLHLFRHTSADDFLSRGGSEGDALALFGWRDRSMLDRYGASNRQNRAILAARRAGFGDRPVFKDPQG